MLKRWFGRRRAPDTLHVEGVAFLREQDGAPEQDLKRELVKLFEQRADVNAAYLVAVRYQGRPDHSIALCITGVPDTHRAEIVEAVSAIFARLFVLKEHLDIMFPSGLEEAQLGEVATPFFVRRNGPY